MKLLTYIIILFYPLNCIAVSWKKFGQNQMGNSYVDVDNIQKINNVVYYWRLFDYAQTSPIGVNSSVSKFTVDCVADKLTWIDSTYYSEPMGKGKVVKVKKSNRTLFPRPGTIEYTTMKFACNYKQLNT
tara:strand:+ start:179 stop:565 length:387 start_codon:yes stop_codon:yes gene_type:complete